MTNRRNFIKAAAASIVTLPVVVMATEGKTVVDPNSDLAKGLFYVENAADTSHANYQAGSNCANCALFTAMEGGAGACSIFSGNIVPAEGWCVAWAKKA